MSGALALVGSTNNASMLAQRLAIAAQHGHLVSPATAAADIPEGCSVVISQVMLDVKNETYDVGGKRGLAKVALERIAAAAGISWDPAASGRLDDASDPYYCAWRAVGTVRHFDGTEVTIEGSKEMDLRPGSAQLEALQDRYVSKHAAWTRHKKGYEPKDPTGQIREMRLHIMAHAESKARLRAIRSIGVRGAYDEAELSKPFVVARLMFTGRSEDPETQRAFSLMTAQAMLGGRRTLYGNAPAAPAALPAPRAMRALPAAAKSVGSPPPPVGQSAWDEDDDLPESYQQAPSQQEPRQATPAAQRRQDSGGAEEGQLSGFTVPGGSEKGTPIEHASDSTLQYWAGRIAKALDAGESRSADRDQRLVDAMRAEMEAR